MWIFIAVIVLFVWYVASRVKKQAALDAKPLPAFPLQDENGNPLLKEVSFTLSGVNHVHDGSDPQHVINPDLKGEWLELRPEPNNKYDSSAVKVLYNGEYIGWLPAKSTETETLQDKRTIFKLLINGHVVLARFDSLTTINIGGHYEEIDDDDKTEEEWDEYDSEWVDGEPFNSAVITCAIYQAPKTTQKTTSSGGHKSTDISS